MTGVAANITGIVSGGTVDYNAVDVPNGRGVSGYPLASAAAASGINPNGTYGPINFTADLHLNAAGPSSAENMGKPEVLAANDIDGQPRDTTFGGTRDAGADEVSAALTASWTTDVSPSPIVSPVAGAPVGLPVPPVVYVKNNTNTASGAFNLELAVSDGYDQTISVSLGAKETKAITFPNWTPAAAISYTFTATSHLTGDVVPGNDVSTASVLAAAPVSIPNGPNTVYNWDTGDSGWTSTNDWKLTSSFTKLGGPLSGQSWVTVCPTYPWTYTEGAFANVEGYSSTYIGPNYLISPWFDLSALATDIYISFQHSIAIEPGWDGSWVDYTTDGVNWHHLGVSNDAVSGAVNWYNNAVYQNSPSALANGTNVPPDTATMDLYNLIGAGTDNPNGLPIAWWTSNGNPGPTIPEGTGTPTGPLGYVFAQYHINASNYPALLGNHL